jgi:hypothetical protein
MDTWLGDVFMWKAKKKWLGRQDGSGQPRLYEQFMTNVVGKGVSNTIVPVRTSATIGLKYLLSLVLAGRLPPPGVIYLDAAHEYPETELEIGLAWQLLQPGGFLVGDDYDDYWPSVQQSVNEFMLRMGFGAFASREYAKAWGSAALPLRQFRMVELLDAPPGRRLAPLLLKNSQWVLRKPGPSAASAGHRDEIVGHSKVQCCINGWADGELYSACAPRQGGLAQDTCREQGGTSNRTCRFRFRCQPAAFSPQDQETSAPRIR